MVKIGRPGKIDDAVLLPILEKGVSNAGARKELAKLDVDVSDEAVRQHRETLEKAKELLPREQILASLKGQAPRATTVVDIKPTDNEPTLEHIEDFLISIREKAAKYDAIEPMYKKMQQALDAKDERISILEKEVEYLKQYIKEKDDKALRWRQARQQDEVHPSLGSCEQLHSNMGEIESISHNIYDYTTQYLISNYGIQYNIKLDAFCFN